ncbi:hypothetical protein pb186bvf_016680 [Paramecium bursaria]
MNLQSQFKILCSQHPEELITNFCCNPECLRPLCPDCIEQHNRSHQQSNTFPDTDSIKNVKNQCILKTTYGRREIQQILEQLQEDEQIAQSTQLIATFNHLEEQFLNKPQIYLELQKNIRNLINQLEFMNVGLEGSNPINSIKKVCSLDLKKNIEKFKKQIRQLQQTEYPTFTQDDKQIPLFEKLLQNYAYFNRLEESRIIQESSFLAQKEYFKNNMKILHFFQADSSNLWIYDLVVQQWKLIQLQNPQFIVPQYSKSIQTPDGQIYLIGGSIPNNKKSGIIHQYQFNNQLLKEVGQLQFQRSSHSLVFYQNEILVIGGIGNNSKVLSFCEAFDITTEKLRRIANLNTPVATPAVCNFDNYVLKACGTEQNQSINNQYEIYANQIWSIIQFKNVPIKSNLGCLVQIEQNTVMYFGGYLEDRSATDDCQIIEITNNIASVTSNLKLHNAEGFQNNLAIVHNARAYVLQDIQDQLSGLTSQKEKRILVFDGKQWI